MCGATIPGAPAACARIAITQRQPKLVRQLDQRGDRMHVQVKETLAAAAGIGVGIYAWFAFIRPMLGSAVGNKSLL